MPRTRRCSNRGAAGKQEGGYFRKKSSEPEGRLPVFIWGVFIIAVHLAFVLGLGARRLGIVELSEGGKMCDSVLLLFFFSSSFVFDQR